MRPNIAVDGPAASGKTTVAKLLADKLGLVYLDTGMMYRAVAWLAVRKQLDLNDSARLVALAESMDLDLHMEAGDYRIYVDGQDISDQLHAPAVSQAVPYIAKVSGIRRNMVKRQQEVAKRGGIIMAGRDIGSVVLPDAKYKYYLDAGVAERARRRCLELQAKGCKVDQDSIEKQLTERDAIDSSRSDSPLVISQGAVVIDSTNIDAESVSKLIARDYAEVDVDG